MTSRERLLTVLRGGEPDRIPWSPCMDDSYTQSLPAKADGSKHDVRSAFLAMGADAMIRHTAKTEWMA